MTNIEIRKEYHNYLILKNYRYQTKKTYLSAIDIFLNYCLSHKSDFNDLHSFAKAYLISKHKEGKSWSTINIYHSAIKMLCEHVLHQKWSCDKLPRPRQTKKLPYVLSGKQAQAIINCNRNLKHKTMLALLYSTGIRVGELVKLQISDICFDRQMLHINLGKGGKDRIIHIPDKMIKLLQSYLTEYQPKIHLFEGQPSNQCYSRSSLIKVIRRAAKKSGITKPVTCHTFRHSYATHHISNGTDVVILQQQMGHKCIKTTLAYIHLCPTRKYNINHPIERLNIRL